MSKYPLIPMTEILDEPRKIAVAWVENYKDSGGIEIQQKQKLASDIQNYAQAYASEKTKPLVEALGGLLKWNAHLPAAANDEIVAAQEALNNHNKK